MCQTDIVRSSFALANSIFPYIFFIPHCLIYTANLWECHSLATGSSLLSKMHRFLRARYQNSISLNAIFMFQSPPPPPPLPR